MKKFGHRIKVFYLNCLKNNSEPVQKLLRQSGHDFEVQRVLNVIEFNNRITSFGPDVVIADHSIHAPGLQEAMETLKQNRLKVPFILITDMDSESLARIMMGTVVSDYVFIERPDRLPLAIFSAAETHRSLQHLSSLVEQSRKEFSDLVANFPIGLSIWSADRTLVYFNHALKRLAYREDDIYQQPWAKITLDIYDESNSPISLEKDLLAICYREGTTVTRDNLYVLKQDGSKHYVKVIAQPSRNGGQIVGATMLFFEITCEKLSRLKIETLSDLVQTKNNELAQFAHVISHHLRDPIAKILGLASICDTSTEDSRFVVKMITQEANKLDSVVKDLNVIVSVRNVEKEKREALAFDHEFSLVSQVLKREIQDSKAMIETDFKDLNEIYTVKSYLYSVLYNLLSNSIKYRDINKPLAIRLRTYRIGQYACLSVADNGLGIDLKKNREKVFGLYKRFHADTIPGKGVGLHFIKSYAEALGGKVEIDSQIDEGTELKVYFLNSNNDESA